MHKNFSITDFSGSFLILFILLIIYVAFPVQSSTIDAYSFACQIKEGDELFLPHHLLYNYLGFLWVKLLRLFGTFDPLASLKVLNALMATSSLLLLNTILKDRGVELKQRMLWLFFIGGTWGVMRFATENETYIAPILFSLWGSYYFGRYYSEGKNRDLFLSGTFTAFAALIHQIHFFWWLALLVALLVYRKSFLSAIKYALPALGVPLVYMLVIRFYYHIPLSLQSFMEFILNDYYSGSASVEFGVINFILTPISFVRTFVQVHGYLFFLGSFNSLYYVGAGVGIFFLITSLFYIRPIRFTKAWNKDFFISAHILAFLFHLGFAFFSHGNAEFMVMLPFFMVIVFSSVLQNHFKFISYTAAGLFIWNLSVGIIPLNQHELDDNHLMAKHLLHSIKVEKGAPYYILYNRPGTINTVRYFSGRYYERNLKGLESEKYKNLKNTIDSLLLNNNTVFTNCIDRPSTLSRAYIVYGNNSDVYSGYHKIATDSVKTLSGNFYLYRLKLADQ